MFTIILFVLSSVALSSCQINVGPQIFPDQSSLSSFIPDKRLVNNQEFKYIISPIQFKNVQNNGPEKQQLAQQHFNKQALLPFIKFSPSEELQVQNIEPVKVPIYLQNEKPNYKHFQGLKIFNSQNEQKPRQQYQLISIPQGKPLQKESSPITEYSNKDQIESELVEQIRQQLGRIVDDTQINWRPLSIVPEEKQYSKVLQAEPSKQIKKQNSEQEKYARKEIEDILRVRGNFESLKPNVDQVEEPNYQKSPFFIHRQETVTKLHPVNIVKQVKVAVPTPILVGVPEPYEVKIPQPYHVPVEVIRHIPVAGKNY